MGVIAAMSHGSATLSPSEGFDPKAALDATTKEKATSMYGVPTMFTAMLEENDKDPERFNYDKLKKGVMAGSVCPEPLL